MRSRKPPYVPDPNGQFARLYHSIGKSHAWLALSSSAIRLYLDMRLKLTSFNNGNIEVVFSELKHRGWKSKTTMHRALRELETLGLIAQTRQGGIASMSKICSLYRFTELDVLEQKPRGISASKATHDYRRFDSIRQALAVVRNAETERKLGRQKKTKVQKADLTSPTSGPMTPLH